MPDNYSDAIAHGLIEILPKKIKKIVYRNLDSVKFKSSMRLNDGYYDPKNKEIRFGHCSNTRYFAELIGHELGHAANIEKYSSKLPRLKKLKGLERTNGEHELADDFANYIIYGKGSELSKYMEKKGMRVKQEDREVVGNMIDMRQVIEERNYEEAIEKYPNMAKTIDPKKRFLK